MSERTVSSTLASRGLVLVALALSLAAPACSQRKISECNALITAINNGVVALEKTPRPEPDPSGAAELESLASAMDRVAQELGAVLVTLPETRKLAAAYQKMAKDIAKAERDLAQATQKRDLQRRAAAEKALDLAVKQEDPLVDDINRFCQGP